MSPGKVAAQTGHAVAGTLATITSDWLYHPQRWMIILEAKNGEQLYHMCEYLTERKVKAHRVIDEGVNETAPFSLTAVGIGPLDKESPEAQYLSALPLYKDDRLDIAYTRGWNAASPSRRKSGALLHYPGDLAQ